MIINHIDGTTVDTDKLSDVNALALEKSEEFRDFMCKMKIPFSLTVCATTPSIPSKVTIFYNLVHPTESTHSVVSTLAYALSQKIAFMTNCAVAVIPPHLITDTIKPFIFVAPPDKPLQ